MLESTSGFLRRGLPRPDQIDLTSFRATNGPGRAGADPDIDEKLVDLPATVADFLLGEFYVPLGILWFWPFIWILGSALFRGGLSLRLVGINLVQADGQPAARWRCAWRTLLVWLPIYLLLLFSLTFDLWRIAACWADPDFSLRWVAAWLSWLAWWLAVVLLGFYPWLALRWPDHSLHDHLAGTWLMPR
jgi:hypothetical protein